jgi:hypothetical protein
MFDEEAELSGDELESDEDEDALGVCTSRHCVLRIAHVNGGAVEQTRARRRRSRTRRSRRATRTPCASGTCMYCTYGSACAMQWPRQWQSYRGNARVPVPAR